VPVRLGNGDAARVEVLEGLSGGDRVVVRGGERLSAGQAVQVASSGGARSLT
jgi:multidrug efflux pump subunit AcrA (membrane-fusion protein)